MCVAKKSKATHKSAHTHIAHSLNEVDLIKVKVRVKVRVRVKVKVRVKVRVKVSLKSTC